MSRYGQRTRIGQAVSSFGRPSEEGFNLEYLVNTGSGGGGANDQTSPLGGAGGKGVVILRTLSSVRTPTTLTVGTLSTSGGYNIYTFNDSGTIEWS